jgi:hypothetical protein
MSISLAVSALQAETRPSGPASQATTRSALQEMDLRYGIYLARLEIHTTIAPDGSLRSARTVNKSYGVNDIDPKHARTEIRAGILTAAQVDKLTALFAGWESLSDKPYGGAPDGGNVRIRYGEKTVSGGSAVPDQVEQVRRYVTDLAATMPIVEQ